MAFVAVDINKIKLDDAPQGFAPVDINAIELDQPSFGQRLSADFNQRKQQAQAINQRANDGQINNLTASALLGGKIGFGMANDVVNEGLGSLPDLPQSVKDIGGAILNATPVPKGFDTAVNNGITGYQTFAKNNPNASDALDAVANTINLAGNIQGGQAIARAASPVTGRAVDALASRLRPAAEDIAASNALPVANTVKSAGGIENLSKVAKDASQGYYDDVAKSNFTLSPDVTSSWIDKAQSIRPNLEALKKTGQLDDVDDYLKSLDNLRDGHALTLQEAQAFDKKLGDSVFDNSENGKLNAKGKDYLTIKNSLLESLEAAPGSEEYKAAVQNYRAKSILDDLTRLQQKADLSTGNKSLVIRNGAKSLIESGMYKGEELAALKQANKTGVLGGLVNILSSKLLAGAAGVFGGAGLGPVGAVLGGAAGMAATEGPKALAASMQAGRLNKVADTVAKRIVPYTKNDIEAAFKARKK